MQRRAPAGPLDSFLALLLLVPEAAHLFELGAERLLSGGFSPSSLEAGSAESSPQLDDTVDRRLWGECTLLLKRPLPGECPLQDATAVPTFELGVEPLLADGLSPSSVEAALVEPLLADGLALLEPLLADGLSPSSVEAALVERPLLQWLRPLLLDAVPQLEEHFDDRLRGECALLLERPLLDERPLLEAAAVSAFELGAERLLPDGLLERPLPDDDVRAERSRCIAERPATNILSLQ